MANKQLPPSWENKKSSAKPNWGKQNTESLNEANKPKQNVSEKKHIEDTPISQESIQQDSKVELEGSHLDTFPNQESNIQTEKSVDNIAHLENSTAAVLNDKIPNTEKTPKKSKVPIVLSVLFVCVVIVFAIVALLHFNKGSSNDNSNANSVATTNTETIVSDVVTTVTETTIKTELTTTQAVTTVSEIITTTESSDPANAISLEIQVYYPPIDIYSGPGYNYEIIDTLMESGEYIIIEECDDGTNQENSMWGKLESGIGWINLYQASITDGIGDYNGGIGEDGLGADETITTENQPQAQTNSTIVDGVTFEYITSYVDNNITVQINSMTITHTQDMAYYDEYEIKVDGQISDALIRDKYIGYYAYDADGYKLENGAFAKVNGAFKESYKLTVWDENTTRIYIDIFA